MEYWQWCYVVYKHLSSEREKSSGSSSWRRNSVFALPLCSKIVCCLRILYWWGKLGIQQSPQNWFVCPVILRFSSSQVHHSPVLFLSWCWWELKLNSRLNFPQRWSFRSGGSGRFTWIFNQKAPVSGPCEEIPSDIQVQLTVFHKGMLTF